MKKLDIHARIDLARSLWSLFIDNVQKIKIHYGKKAIFIVVQLEEQIDTDNVTEAHMVSRQDGYSELTNVPMSDRG